MADRMVTVEWDDGRSRTIYTEENGRYFSRHVVWSEKYGMTIPQGKKRISKKAFEAAVEQKGAEQ